MVKNVIGLSIIFLGALIVGAYYNHVTPFWTGDKTKQLEVIWQQDMETLIKNKKLPNEWRNISEIKVQALSEPAKNILSQIDIPITAKQEGDYLLEISVDGFEEQAQTNLVVQYFLIHKPSKNLIWEFGRTFRTPLE